MMSRPMHPLDPILLIAIANVVAWPVTLYLEDDHRRVVGHLATCLVGAFTVGLLAQWMFPETFKLSLMIGAFIGAGGLLFLVRFRKRK